MPRAGYCISEFRNGLVISGHVTEISCIKGPLLGSLGSSLDSAAHLASFFISVSPDVPMDEMASALFKALEKQHKHKQEEQSGAWPAESALPTEAITFYKRKLTTETLTTSFSWLLNMLQGNKELGIEGVPMWANAATLPNAVKCCSLHILAPVVQGTLIVSPPGCLDSSSGHRTQRRTWLRWGFITLYLLIPCFTSGGAKALA